VDFTDIRQRLAWILAWILAGLRHQRARESDLIYEAYYDAVRSDMQRTPMAIHPASNHPRPAANPTCRCCGDRSINGNAGRRPKTANS